jgi:predicted Holliday junction resolvase-like endonuclease
VLKVIILSFDLENMSVEILGGVSALLLIILILVIVYYSRKVSQLNKKITEVQLNSHQIAQQMFNNWINQYSQQLQKQLEQSIEQKYKALLETWKQQYEQMIRKDAIARSVNTLLGKIGEEFAPILLADKYQVNPKDFRHLGSPVDYIAFKGLSDDNADPEVIFIEVKTGKSTSLTERERKVRDAIKNGKVRYEVVSLNDLIGEVQKKINEEISKLS